MKTQEKGSVIILMSGLIIILTGFAALAIDVGRIYIVRNELQNAADSAALAGANCLIDHPKLAGSVVDCTSPTTTALNWTRASAKAVDQLGNNSAANLAISTTDTGHQVSVGYWNVNGGTTLQAISLSPLGPCTTVGGVMTTACDKPAVSVTITKDTGKNNGPIAMLTASMFGGSNVPMTAKAVAVLSSPGNVLPGSLIPQAINKCMFDLYWDSTTNTPKLATANILNGVPQIIGQPWEVRIGSSYHYLNCESGQWTSFGLDVNNTPAVRDLIANGNPTPLGIGDNTWIEPGTKNTLYDALDTKYPTPPGADVTIAVVNNPTGWSTNTQTPIVAFAGFQITDIQGGSLKYMQGHFITSLVTASSSGIGPFYGTYTPPRLAQ